MWLNPQGLWTQATTFVSILFACDDDDELLFKFFWFDRLLKVVIMMITAWQEHGAENSTFFIRYLWQLLIFFFWLSSFPCLAFSLLSDIYFKVDMMDLCKCISKFELVNWKIQLFTKLLWIWFNKLSANDYLNANEWSTKKEFWFNL